MSDVITIEEKHYTPAELAKFWGLSADKIRRMFCDEPGVVAFGGEGTLRKRAYKTLRIPASVAKRVRGKLVQ